MRHSHLCAHLNTNLVTQPITNPAEQDLTYMISSQTVLILAILPPMSKGVKFTVFIFKLLAIVK